MGVKHVLERQTHVDINPLKFFSHIKQEMMMGIQPDSPLVQKSGLWANGGTLIM